MLFLSSAFNWFLLKNILFTLFVLWTLPLICLFTIFRYIDPRFRWNYFEVFPSDLSSFEEPRLQEDSYSKLISGPIFELLFLLKFTIAWFWSLRPLLMLGGGEELDAWFSTLRISPLIIWKALFKCLCGTYFYFTNCVTLLCGWAFTTFLTTFTCFFYSACFIFSLILFILMNFRNTFLIRIWLSCFITSLTEQKYKSLIFWRISNLWS